MSRAVPENLTCPACGTAATFTTWSSLNVTLDPDKKRELLAGELTRFTCAKCGDTTNVSYPLLYHDMQRQLMLWHIPAAPGEAPSPADDTGVVERLPETYVFRTVRDLNELREKIYMFEAQLDDRVIEIVKLVLRSQAPADRLPTDAKLLFSGVDENQRGTTTLAFAILTADGQQSGLTIPKEPIYGGVAGDFAAFLASPVPRGWQTVDAGFAAAMIEGTMPDADEDRDAARHAETRRPPPYPAPRTPAAGSPGLFGRIKRLFGK